MDGLSQSRVERLIEQLDELREEDALDPQVRAARSLFDLAAFYVLIWIGIGAAAILVIYPVGWIATSLGASRKTTIVLLLLISLGIAIATFWSFDSEAGKKRERWLRRQARAYMPIIAVALAFSAGWYWGHNNPTDAYRADAEKAAWKVCGQIPACVHRATIANGGNDVLQYIAPLPDR